MQKYLKATISSYFFSIFRRSWNQCGSFQQIPHLRHIFYNEKFEMVIFHLPPKKMSKTDNFGSFSASFWVLVWKCWKPIKISCRCSAACIFSSEKNLRWYYFIFSQNLLKKCLKLTIFCHLYPFLGGLKLLGEILKNYHIFHCSASRNLSTDLLENVQKCTRKCKND